LFRFFSLVFNILNFTKELLNGFLGFFQGLEKKQGQSGKKTCIQFSPSKKYTVAPYSPWAGAVEGSCFPTKKVLSALLKSTYHVRIFNLFQYLFYNNALAKSL